jgi:HEAT repeat protein
MRFRASFALGALAWSLAVSSATAQPKTLKKMTIPADAPAEVRAQIERLMDKDPATRADAVMKLGGFGPKAAAALPFLVETARDETKVPINGESQSINAIVAESLKEIDGPGSVPLLIRLIDEKDGRNGALMVLGVVGDTRATPRVLKALGENDAQLRFWAIFALKHIKDPASVDGLAAAFKDTSTLGAIKVAKLVHESIAEALGEIGDARVVPPLAEYIRTGKFASARLGSAKALGVAKRPEGVEPLLALLSEPTAYGTVADGVPVFHAAAAESLGLIKDPRAVDPLLACLKECKDDKVRAEAARALGRIGDKRAFDALHAVLRDGTQPSFPRLGAAVGIEALDDPRAIETMIAVLDDKDLAKVAGRYLKSTTGQDLGTDGAAWRKWWEEDKRRKAAPKAPAAALSSSSALRKPAPRKPAAKPSPGGR